MNNQATRNDVKQHMPWRAPLTLFKPDGRPRDNMPHVIMLLPRCYTNEGEK